MKYLSFLTLAICLYTAAAATELKKDVEYGKAGDVSLKLDVSIPDGEGPFPVAILVHGGGWTAGDKEKNFVPLFPSLTQAHFVWVSVNYRLAPQYRYPACVEDVEQSIRWVKAHTAEFKGDPKRIALIGESAGGHIVSMVALRAKDDTRVDAVIPFYGPHDLEAA